MTLFVEPLWGFSIEVPDAWVHRRIRDSDAFAETERAFIPGYSGPLAGHLMLQAEWNGRRAAVVPIWEEHVTRAALMFGAKRAGSATWQIGPARGMEAELALPRQQAGRLWLGILAHDLIVIKALVYHPLSRRSDFEPQVTAILRSLRFLPGIESPPRQASGLPLPPDSTSLPPEEVLSDLGGDGTWEAYATPHSVGAVQAFYWREAPAAGWDFTAFQPFPGDHPHPFARLGLRKGKTVLALGILPHVQGPDDQNPSARLVLNVR